MMKSFLATHLKKSNVTIVLAATFCLLNFICNAQCKSVVNEGIIKLSPYMFNGRACLVTTTQSTPGIIHLSFYKGYYYKLQLNHEHVFDGNINFRVFTEYNEEVYNSTKNPNNNNSWVFFSNTSQNLTVEIFTKEKIKTHCTALLVGIEIPKKADTQARSSQIMER